MALAAMLLGAKASMAAPAASARPQPMDENQFWSLVEQAKAQAGVDLDQRPQSLEKHLVALSAVPRREYFDLESFGYAALYAHEQKGGGELERDFNVELAPPTGEAWQEADLPALLPKLSAKYQQPPRP